MSQASRTLEERMEDLAARVQALESRMEQLQAGPQGAAASLPPPVREVAPEASRLSEFPEFPEGAANASDQLLTWAGRTHLLTRLSTLCFLLVVALVLRTITDNKLIGTLAGSGLGMGYAAVLMIWGAWRYEKKNPLAPVFACCGAVLMSVIVLETHTRFASLPLVPAYLTLIVTGVSMTLVSYRHHAFLPMSLGTLGMCLAGAAIDYPHPFFPYLAMILFTANILGYFAARLRSCAWLRWIVLLVTMAMLQLWGVRLGMTLLAHEQPTPDLAAPWFLPTLALFTALYLAIACAGIVRSSDQRISRFDFMLPTMNALWSFTAAYYAVNAFGGSKTLLGLIGVTVAAGHLAVTVWLSRRKIAGDPGSNSFAFAGAALSAAALPLLTGSFLLSLPVLSIGAFFMAILSREWNNGGIRATAYTVQIYAAAALAVGLQLSKTSSADPLSALPALLLGIVTLYQYQWCRRYPPPSPSVFSRLDYLDRSAVLLLLAALSCGFLTFKVVLAETLGMFGNQTNAPDMLHSGESIAINLAAAGIMYLAYLRDNKEIRNVAFLVILVGAVKVFLYDLLGTHGFSLVASIFTFGLAAALQSVALGRWHKRDAGEEALKPHP